MGSRVGKELAYTLFPPALQSGIAALPLCLRWPSLAPHLPDSFPAPEKPLGVGRMGGGAAQLCLSFRVPFSLVVGYLAEDELATGE